MKRYSVIDIEGKKRHYTTIEGAVRQATKNARAKWSMPYTWTVVDNETDERIIVTEHGTWSYIRRTTV